MANSKKDKHMEAKQKARLAAKVRPDEPVKEDRIYLNMPKKKSSTNKTVKKTPAKRGRPKKSNKK